MSARPDDHMSAVGAPHHPHQHAHPDYGQGKSQATPSLNRAASGSGSGAARKRASRAGTRSVSTLSPSQLERKRANDREAQRAIRLRTKEHIDKLERRIVELSSNDERNTQLLAALKRVKELEDENQMLKASLQQANYAMGVSDQSGNWPQVPHLKTPMPGQPAMRMTSQQEMRPSAVSPQSNVTRNDSSFPQSSGGWQSATSYGNSPMSGRGFGSTSSQGGMRSAEDPNQQWRYGRNRAQTTPLGEDSYNKPMQPGAMAGQQQQQPQQAPQTHQQQQQQHPHPQSQPPPQQQQQQIDYSSYSMPAPPSNPAPVGRANSQPHLYQSEAEQHDQHMRHLSEQLGLSPVETRYGGQQPMMQQQQPGPRHALPGMAAQSPGGYQQPQSAGGPLKPPNDQQMYYAPYSAR